MFHAELTDVAGIYRHLMHGVCCDCVKQTDFIKRGQSSSICWIADPK